MNQIVSATDLLILDPKTFVAATYEPFSTRLEAAMIAAPAEAPDVTTKPGMELAKEHRRTFKDIRIELEKKRAAAKAPILEIGKLLDSSAKEISKRIEPLEARFDDVIKAEEARIEAEREAKAEAEGERQAKIQAALDEIRNAPVQAATASAHDTASMLAGIVMIRDSMPTENDPTYQERTAEAMYLLNQAIPQMESMLAGKKAQEELAAQLESRRIEQVRIAAEQEAERLASQKREHENMQAEAARQKVERDEIARQRAELEAMQRKLDEAAAEQDRIKLEAEEQRQADELEMQRLALEHKPASDKTRIVVDVAARIDWPNPPKDRTEEAMREHANVMAAAAGKKLEIAVQLLVAELLNASA